MATLGLQRWLSRLKHRKNPVSVEKPGSYERPLKRWCYRPVLEQLEDRVAVGSLLVRPIVPDGYWVFDNIDSPALNHMEPSVQRIAEPAPAPETMSVAPPSSSGGASTPRANLPASPGQANETAPFPVDAAADLGRTPLDINAFVALDNIFPAAPASAGGGGAALPDGSTAGAVGGGAGAGGSSGGAAGASGAGTSGGMSPALNDSSPGAPLSSFSPGGAGSSAVTQNTKPSPAPATISKASPVVSSVQPAPAPRSSAPVTPPGVGVVPVSANPAPTDIVLPPSPPVLHVAQAFGPASQGRLFVQGSLTNVAAMGTQVQLDFYAAVGQDFHPAVPAPPTGKQSWGTYLGSKTIAQTRPGAIDFTVNLKADVAPGTWVGATVHGRSDAPVWSNGIVLTAGADPLDKGVPAALEALAPHGGDGNQDGIPDNQQADVVSVPTTNGEFITLESPGHRIVDVQVFDPPATGVAMPLGLVGFKLLDVTAGGSATVRMIVPDDIYLNSYYKQDPVTGRLTPFNYDGTAGAEIDGHVITLHLVDGGRGDSDGKADGVITDPGGGGAGTITMPTTGWTYFQTGGSGGGVGSVTPDSSGFLFTEGNSFQVGMKQAFTVPSSPNILTFYYSGLSFDPAGAGQINDAFEAAFVDSTGKSLVPTIAPGRDAFFNITRGLAPALASGVTVQSGTVDLDISKLFAVTTIGTLIFRLVNNDHDSLSTVHIAAFAPPAVTAALLNDTAPTGPGSDPYRSDLLTNDPTITGTVSADTTTLLAQVDPTGTWTDITATINNGQYTWYPGTLAYGSHTITVQATRPSGTSSASVTFTVNQPPTANAGGNQTISEGSATTFDGSLSTDAEAPIFSYLWTFPDGSTASGPYASFKFVQDGSYPVILAVTDTAGSVVTNTATVTVTNLPAVLTTPADQVVNEAGTANLQTSFTDPGTLDTHTASINWGDGATSVGTVIEANGTGTISGSHPYQEEGSYTASVTVTDNGGASTTANFTVTVNDAPPLLTISGSASVNEGTSYVLNLAAASGPDPVSGWTINWGDGTNSTAAGTASSVSHTYSDGPTQYTITATATTDDGVLSANALLVGVNNIAPTVSISGNASVNEGSAYTLNLSGSVDTVDADPITGWNITWGDGTTQTLSGNPSSATHVYLDGPHTYTVSVSAVDRDGSYNTNNLTLSVNNVAPAVTANNLTGQTAQTLTFSGGFTDPGILDTHTATVNWGDGSANSTGTVTESAGNGTVSTSHSYSAAGTYTVTLTVMDKDGGATSATSTATITAIPPTLTISGPSSITEGATYTLNLSASGGTPTSWTIAWGDGNPQTVSGNPSSVTHVYADGPSKVTITATAASSGGTSSSNALAVTVNAIAPAISISGASSVNEGSLYTLTLTGTPDSVDSDSITGWKVTWGDGVVQNVSGNPSSVTHTYLDGPHTYSISASAVDKDGSYNTNNVSVTVNNVTPTVTANNLSGNEGQSLNFFGTFSDPGILDTHTATISWGDNSTSSGTVTEANGSGTVTGTHVYADNGTYTITLSVTDKDSGTGSRTATATISNVAPTATACADPTEVKNAAFTVQVGSFTDPGFTNATAGTQETFTATINWGDGSATANGSVTVTQGSAGVLTSGTVTGTYTYTSAGDYTVTVTVTDDDGGTGTAHLVIHALAHGAAKFYVVDQPAHEIFRYDAVGNSAGATALSTNNQRVRGVVSNGNMDTLWIVDANKNAEVYVYNPDGSMRSRWYNTVSTQPQDIATDGSDVWIVDKGSRTVYRFAGGAGYVTGQRRYTSSFALDPANQSPSGMVTDGSTIWITDDNAGTNNVFVYDLSGVKLGSWTLDATDSTPSGITLNPNFRSGGESATDLWVVDRATARVYRYAGGSAWRSGSRSATSSFALDPNDQHPEGIADPTVTLQAPPANSSFPQGGPVLVSGTAQANTGATLTDVTLNNTGVTVDAGGDFFQQLQTGAGQNNVTVTASDSSNSTASSSVSFTGTAPVTATPSNPGAIDFSMLSDVTGSFSPVYGRTSFNNGSSVLYADLSAQNIGTYNVRTSFVVGVRHISAPSVRVRGNTGVMADGTPFYDYSSLVVDNGSGLVIGPGQTTQAGTLSFFDPEGLTFTYDLVFLGRLNHAPRFTSTPVVKVVAGQTYNYVTTAADADGDFLRFDKIAGPAGLDFSDHHAGTLTWLPTSSDVGTQVIRLRVSDNQGGTADQTFILSVLSSGTNYPPNFISEPVVDANVNTPYTYQAASADLDADAQTFSVVSGPAGLTINRNTGLVQWTPTVSQLGTQSVTLQVTDAGGLSATQVYGILVQQPAGNQPPVFVTTAPTSVAAGSFYVYPSKAIDPDNDPVSYTLTSGPGSMVIDPVTGNIVWQTLSVNAGNSYPVTILASDGRGGTTTQSFTVTVTSSSGAAPGALFGAKYSDLNGNGQRDPITPVNPTGLGPIGLKQVPLATVATQAVAYDQPLSSMLVVGKIYGISSIYRVQADGTELLYANLGTQVLDGTTLAVVRSDNTAGFTPGDIFVPTDSLYINGQFEPTIMKVSNGGATVQSGWVTLPTAGDAVATYLDPTGVFGDKLLVLVAGTSGNVEVWTVDGAGNTARLAYISNAPILAEPGECGMLSVPNNVATYGAALAGELLIVSDSQPVVAVNVNGNVTFPKGTNSYGLPVGTGLDRAEGLAIVPAAANFFAIADSTASISVAAAAQFAPIQGQIVVVQETGAIQRVWFDGSSLQTQQLAFTPDSITNRLWYEDAFAPVPLGPVPAPPLEPGLPNWTLYLDNNHDGQLDNGEPSTTTDANGNYAFYNLAPGSYTVAEVQQPGWTQKAPAPVPPGTYSVSLASGQALRGLDFGNQQNPTPPPQPLIPPSGIPDLPPVFNTIAPNPGSATVGIPFLYSAAATDPESDYPLTFDLPVHPAGMVVDPVGGGVAWLPTAYQAGTSASVLLRVTDTKGSVALQSFTVNVVAGDTPPVITSTPTTTASPLVGYQYQVLAQDAERDQLTYSIASVTPTPYSPNANPLIINATTGLLTWTPTWNDMTNFTITLQVSDGRGGTARQTFGLTVTDTNKSKTPTITSSPRTQIAINQNYLYAVQAGDTDGDLLTYSLPVAPAGMSISSAGLVSWRPTGAQLGNNSVQVRVADPGGLAATQSFTINVTEQAVNHPPVITSTPVLSATVGQVYYAYNVQGSDPDNDPLSWSLPTAPAGMSINGLTGTIRWTPLATQVGNQAVTVRLVDNFGGVATQSFTVTVRGVNLPPVITSTPVLTTPAGTYTYAVQAGDADGDGLTYAVSGLTPGTTVSAAGLITATKLQLGTYTVTVTVSDRSAGDPLLLTATQTYTLTVASVNHPPVITSQPPVTAVVGSGYTYAVQAKDPDPNTTLTYSLATDVPTSFTSQPGINSSTGVLTWTSPQLNNPPGSPANMPTNYHFTVTVSDGSLQAKQLYVLTVRTNSPPTISPITGSTATVGASYRYDVQASDPDGDPLTYALSNAPGTAPNVMQIDQNGRLTWSPTATGTYNNITVTVTDPYGASATRSFNLTVTADTTPPTIELQISPTSSGTAPLPVGTKVTFLVFASDNVGVTSLKLTVGTTNVPLDDKGQGQMTMTTAGNFTATAIAGDAAGNTTTAPLQTVYVSNPTGTPPTITPGTGYPAADAVITAPTTFSATVSDDHVGVSYVLQAIPFDGTPNVPISSGSTTTASSLLFTTTFDPTMLANGDYTLDLRATDTDDNLTTVLDRHISIQANLKLGRETLSVTDLTIPVAGIPITVIRTYDSLNAAKSMDFGYGWQLSFGDAQLKVDLVPGSGQTWGDFPAFTDGTHVYVTMPGGQREGFTFTPWPEGQLFGALTYWHPAFTPDAGVIDQLTVPDVLLSQDGNQYFTIETTGLNTYNPADPIYGDQYTLKNLDGTGYEVTADTGKLFGMTARNGNSLTFTNTAVTSNTGKTVSFTRDPAGHIVAIADPRGNSVKYGYDASGNLVSVTDRANDPPTAYTYDPNHPHYLSTVVDPLGVQQLQVQYDSSNGRMTQMIDAKGNPLNFGYNPSNLSETVTDPNLPVGSQTATVTLDARGNPLNTTGPTGAQSSATFNNTQSAAKDLPDTVTQVKRNPDNTTTTLTTHVTYDSNGEMTSVTDPSGAVTRTTYGPFGAELTVSDPLGNTVTSSFDPNGNLLSTVSATGVTTLYSYDAQNNLVSVTQTGSHSGIGGSQSPPAPVTRFSYDASGYLASSTSPTGIITNFSYDPNGNGKGSSFTWINPVTPGDSRPVATSNSFDPNDRQTTATNQYSQTSQTHHDAKGRVTQTIDVLGNPTGYLFDASDHVIQTTLPNGTVTESVYDGEGRVSYSDDAHVAGQATVRGTHTIYDSLDRVTETDRLDNIVITITTSNGVSNSQVTSAGNVIATTKAVYNDLGQVIQNTDAANQSTQYQYDAAGRQTAVTDALNETTLTNYDAAGRHTSTTDALAHITRNVLDGDGRVTQTIFADGSSTHVGYDALGRRTSVTDQMGNTTQYQYDNADRLAAVIAPSVVDPRSQQIVQPITQYSYDNYGDLTGITDANGHLTSFTFDQNHNELTDTLPLGQVESATYDSFGRISAQTDFAGQKTQYHYDTLGRVDTKTFYAAGSTSPGETMAFSFDSLGREYQITDTVGSTVRVTQYGFDAENRINSITTPEGTTNYVFDSATGFHTRTYTANSDITYSPDALQRLKT
ncbi:MAG TPA: PKD domain-containing protein, partial [Gemmataceae bacterium]|nr:PKD domain-containing protein [Gemmataceae bacterium]